MAAAFGVLGLIIGSFLNVLIIRRHLSALGGRSHCMSCGVQLAWYDNLPLISWILLRGRCRSCGSAIALQYPLVEALTGVLFALVGAVPMLTLLERGLLCVVCALSIALAGYDIRHTILPDAWLALLAIASLCFSFLHVSPDLPLSLLLGAGPFAALPLFALWLVSRGTWMGFGDVKLALAIGWLLGPWYGPIAIMGAFIIGALVSVPFFVIIPRILAALRARGITRLSPVAAHLTMTSEVPFGPFLIASQILICFALLFQIPLPL